MTTFEPRVNMLLIAPAGMPSKLISWPTYIHWSVSIVDTRHMSQRPRYWSWKAISTKSAGYCDLSTFMRVTSLWLTNPNESAICFERVIFYQVRFHRLWGISGLEIRRLTCPTVCLATPASLCTVNRKPGRSVCDGVITSIKSPSATPGQQSWLSMTGKAGASETQTLTVVESPTRKGNAGDRNNEVLDTVLDRFRPKGGLDSPRTLWLVMDSRASTFSVFSVHAVYSLRKERLWSHYATSACELPTVRPLPQSPLVFYSLEDHVSNERWIACCKLKSCCGKCHLWCNAHVLEDCNEHFLQRDSTSRGIQHPSRRPRDFRCRPSSQSSKQTQGFTRIYMFSLILLVPRSVIGNVWSLPWNTPSNSQPDCCKKYGTKSHRNFCFTYVKQ